MADHSILPPIGLGGSGAPTYDGGRVSRCSSQSSNASTPHSRVPSAYQGSVKSYDYCVFRNQRSRSDSTRSRQTGNRFPTLRSRSTSDVRSESVKSRYTTYHASPRMDKNGFLQRSPSEECLKCMLKIPHNKCEGHKYIRVGGGYRHSYLYVKAMLEEIELKKKAEALLQQRLEAIQEKQVKAIKTYIRTKSGKLVERMVFLSEEDYQKFIAGGKDAEDIIRKYLSQEEAKGLEKWEKDEQRAITTFIRTKSGRRIEKIVYVSKEEYEAIKRGDIDATEALKKYINPDEGTVEGWGEAEMKEIKTYIRTKSGRVIEKRILVSKEDYEKLQELERQGKDPGEIFKKYMSMNEGEKVESWKKPEPTAMKVIKAYVRTKSGKLIEKTIMMTEEEYRQFQESGGDMSQLHKYMNLQKGEVIEDWEKASTVYSASDDEEVKQAIPGTRIVGKDGTEYEVVVDPITGKKYKKKIGGKESDVDSGIGSLRNKKGAQKGPYGIGIDEEDPAEAKMTKEEVKAYRAGKRREDSDSDFSYRSVKSAGGTRHVYRKHKRADGTYSDEESYHSDQDEEGKKRRQVRRGERKKQAVAVKKKKFEQGKRNTGSDSDFSYKSEVSAGGTRHVKRRRKRADGTYSAAESYHSSQDEEGEKRRRKRRKERIKAVKEGKRRPGSASDYSYKSEVSAGGTRHVKRRRKRADGTYSREESYHSSQDEGGQDRRKQRRKKRQEAFKHGKRNKDSDSDYSYRSVVSAGGTRHVKRRRKRADGTYSREESYHSGQDEDGETRRRRRRRERKHGAGSAHSYRSVISEGGTRHVKRRRRRADGTYSAEESYHSSDSDFFVGKGKKGKKKRREHGSDSDHSYYSVVSAGGTKHRKRKEKIRDKDGKVIGYAKSEAYTSPSDSDSSYEMKPDGKGGMMRVKKKGKKGKQGKRPEWKPGAEGYVSDPLDNDSLQSTDSEAEKEVLKNMTEEEKEKYFEEKAKRKAEREKKRKEKYGDKYEEIMEKHDKAKKAKKEWKSMVNYERGGRGGPGDEYDDREPGMGHGEWTKGKKKGKKYKDGNEADDETEDESDGEGGRRKKKKKGGADSDEESVYEYARDAKGNILRDAKGNPIKKKVGTISKKGKKKGGAGGDDSDSDFEYKYDAEGNLIRKKKEKRDDGEESDGDYFEVAADGTVTLKKGKKKIDISKLTSDQLRQLGIDPNLSKQEITRLLKEKFGDEIRIESYGKKVGLKHLEDYGSDANTDDLADDSDLDTSTLTGQRRVRVLMRRGGADILDHLKKLINSSNIVDPEVQHPEERDASIDFLNHYRLVDTNKLDPYARAFAVEDEDLDCVITTKDARTALDGVPSIHSINKKQIEYVLKVLDIDKETAVTFRMFAVMVAVAERVTHMDSHCKKLLEIANLRDIERKMDLYKSMFYCNVEGDRNANYIKADSLKIDLIAGGLSWTQQEYIMEKMQPNEWREVSFLDYLTYIPLFMSMHDNICDNPLDMSNNKYGARPASPAQRDMNPLGHHLKKDSVFIQRHQRAKDLSKKAEDLLSGKKPHADALKESGELLNKYQKLPGIIGKNDTTSYMSKGKKK